MTSCQNSEDDTFPWMKTTVRSGGVDGSSPSRSRMLTFNPGVSTDVSVMPSKRVMGGSFAVHVGAPAPPSPRL